MIHNLKMTSIDILNFILQLTKVNEDADEQQGAVFEDQPPGRRVLAEVGAQLHLSEALPGPRVLGGRVADGRVEEVGARQVERADDVELGDLVELRHLLDVEQVVHPLLVVGPRELRRGGEGLGARPEGLRLRVRVPLEEAAVVGVRLPLGRVEVDDLRVGVVPPLLRRAEHVLELLQVALVDALLAAVLPEVGHDAHRDPPPQVGLAAEGEDDVLHELAEDVGGEGDADAVLVVPALRARLGLLQAVQLRVRPFLRALVAHLERLDGRLDAVRDGREVLHVLEREVRP